MAQKNVSERCCPWTLGRRLTMLIAGIFLIGGVIFNVAAQNLAMLIVRRILLGCGVGFANQIGLLFFITGFWGFFPLFQAIFTFPQELMMLEKERSSGMYRLSSYFISRMVADLPMELVLPTVFLLITYFMAGLKATAINFFETLFTLLLNVLAAQGLGLALGAAVLDQKSATTLASVLMLVFLLAGGFYVQNVPKFIAWLKYISISYYTYQLFTGSQFHSG